MVSEGSERGGVGWELVVVEGEGCVVNQAALPKVGTCKSGEWRVGTRPNESSAALYKYSRAGSTRLLLLVAKKHWDTGVSPSWRRVFNSLLIIYQSRHKGEPRIVGFHQMAEGTVFNLSLEEDKIEEQHYLLDWTQRGGKWEVGRHLNIYPDRNQFTYHWSEHSSQVSPADKHTVVVQQKLHRRPKSALGETWPTWYCTCGSRS